MTSWLKNKAAATHNKVGVVKKQRKSSELVGEVSNNLVHGGVEEQVAPSDIDDVSDSENDDDYAWLSKFNFLYLPIILVMANGN